MWSVITVIWAVVASVVVGGAFVALLASFWLSFGMVVSDAPSGPASVVADRLKTEEGFRGLPYDDTQGHATIGYGTELPITKAEAAWLLESRLADTHARLAEAWMPYVGLNQARQGALLDMAYELGVAGLLEIPHHASSP